MECWVRSFVACYGLRVASHALQRLVRNILTRNSQHATRNALKLIAIESSHPRLPSYWVIDPLIL